MSTELTVAQRASVALGSTEHERKLQELAKQSTEIVAITNPASYTQLHAARMVLKNERIGLEKLGKAARDDATKFSKAVIVEQARLIAIIEPEEIRLEEIQRAHDERVALEKAAREQAERERVERIQAAIQEIKMADAGLTVLSGSVAIAATLENLKAAPVDEQFAEFKAEAEQAKVLAVLRLNALHAGALEYEAEQRRVKEEREELARLKAAEDLRQREAAEREAAEIRARAEADAQARAKIAAEEAAANERIAAQARAAQAEIDRLANEARARQAAEDARQQAERDRIAEEGRRVEAAARAQRDAAEAAERQARAKAEEDQRAAEALARQEQEAREAEQRETQRKADEEARIAEYQRNKIIDAKAMLQEFLARFGKESEFAAVTRAIIQYFNPRETVANAGGRAKKDRAAA